MGKAKPTPPVEEEPGLSKMDMVREAARAGAVKPKDGVPWIKEKFGTDMGPTMFSSYMTKVRKELNLPSGRLSADLPRAEATAVGGISLDTVREVKALVDEHGLEVIVAVTKLVTRYGVGGLSSALEVVKLFGEHDQTSRC